MQRDRAADGDARERHLSCDAERIEQACDIVGHRVDGKLAAHLLRQSGAAGVVTQHAAGSRKPWRHAVPALERAAHFVHQHQGAFALAAELVAQSCAVQFNEIHSAFSFYFLAESS